MLLSWVGTMLQAAAPEQRMPLFSCQPSLGCACGCFGDSLCFAAMLEDWFADRRNPGQESSRALNATTEPGQADTENKASSTALV